MCPGLTELKVTSTLKKDYYIFLSRYKSFFIEKVFAQKILCLKLQTFFDTLITFASNLWLGVVSFNFVWEGCNAYSSNA